MRGSKPKNLYLHPGSLIDLQKKIGRHSAYRFIAGGTDLMPNRYQGISEEPVLIDLSDLIELKGIKQESDQVTIGSMVSLHEIIENHMLQKDFSLLAKACLAVGSPLIRNSATLGGNLLCENRCLYFNQSAWWRDAIGSCLKDKGDRCIATGSLKSCFSEFVSDTAPALIVLNAQVEIMDATGKTRIIPVEALYTGDGIQPRTLNPGDLLLRIILPKKVPAQSYFRKLRQRQSLDFTALTLAATLSHEGILHLSASGLDPKPIVIKENLDHDIEKIEKAALRQARAVDNDMLSRKYRRQMLRVFIKDCFTQFKI